MIQFNYKGLMVGLAATTMVAGGAVAATDGTEGETSVGTMDVTVNVDVPNLVQISGLGDVTFTYGNSEYQSGGTAIHDTQQICIYSTSSTGFLIEADGLNDSSAPPGNRHATSYFDGAMTHYAGYEVKGQFESVGGSYIGILNTPTSFNDSGSFTDATCSGTGGTNFDLRLSLSNSSGAGGMKQLVTDNGWQGAGAIAMTDTITLTVTPGL